MTTLQELEIIKTDQALYDCFNGFMMSSDLKVFGKLFARFLLMQKVKNIPGDIVECGVFKGSGLFTFLKLKRYLNPNSGKKVIGFDFFDTESLINSLSDQDKKSMTVLFKERKFKHKDGYEKYLQKEIKDCGFLDYEYELIKGDVSSTIEEYIRHRPGFKISLLYLDLDLEVPTYEVLSHVWDRVSKGGVVVFDEYAFHKWSEAKGADRFFESKGVDIKSLNFIAPSAYVVKE